jgi:putative membrane protein
LEYRWFARYLWSKDFRPLAGVDEFPHHTPIIAVTVIMIFIGVFAFCAVLLRVH